jgi:hypothetical protein
METDRTVRLVRCGIHAKLDLPETNGICWEIVP